MDMLRLANHAGRSIWNKAQSVSHFSIGIELEGFYTVPPTPAQRVLTHSMVAYGLPNKYFDDDHRGRRRCGMMMARPEVRVALGLNDFPDGDPEIRARRLIIADRPLFAFLYNPETSIGIFDAKRSAVDQYLRPLLGEDPNPVFRPPPPSPIQLDPMEDHADEPVKFREIGVDGLTAYALVGKKFNDRTTIYFLPDGRIFDGEQLSLHHPGILSHLPRGTKLLVGYTYGGKVLPERSAFSIVRKRWVKFLRTEIARFPVPFQCGQEVLLILSAYTNWCRLCDRRHRVPRGGPGAYVHLRICHQPGPRPRRGSICRAARS